MTYIVLIMICFFLNGYALIQEQLLQEYFDSEEKIMPEKDNVKQPDEKYMDAEEEVFRWRNQRTRSHSVKETIIEQRSMDENHKFIISGSVEYSVKFDVPGDIIDTHNDTVWMNVVQVSILDN